MARGRRIVWDDSSDEEFPDIHLFKAKASHNTIAAPPAQTDQHAAKGIVRRRKLGGVVDNPLLRPVDSTGSSQPLRKDDTSHERKKSTTPQKIELRARKTRPLVTNFEVDDSSEAESIQEQTIVEGFSEDDGDNGSDFEATRTSDSEDDSFDLGDIIQRSPSKPKMSQGDKNRREASGERKRSPSPSSQLLAEALEAEERDNTQRPRGSRGGKCKNRPFLKETKGSQLSSSTCLADPLSKFHLHELKPPRSNSSAGDTERPTTPTSPTLKFEPIKGLASPTKKIPRIPATPHHPEMDSFWDQGFIDDWNDEHSPKKQLFLPSATTNSPTKKRTSSPTKKGELNPTAAQRAARKAFSDSKHEVATSFLVELDERITKGKISELSAATGGVRIEWANKLNTTAGRANWKRETIKQKGSSGETVSVQHKHHASIELSTKVIDDSHRLLNVIAHEFCHLANFMVSGITTNPHGKEFKGWAAKVTREFGGRGIEVTTKHSYDIDFKYVWECTACGLEFKRHSKSINTERHRCGACKCELKQTKPVPRAKPSKESEYHQFMKEQMKLIKEENPGSPQKEIMKMVASRWSQKEKNKRTGDDSIDSSSSSLTSGGKNKVEPVTKSMNQLTIVDLT